MNTIEHTPAAKAETPKVAKFFHFSQNNSGGSFDIDETVAHHVIIEAHSAKEANDRAKDIGIYFNGCENGSDCHCCGDRWYEAWDNDAADAPLVYGEPPETYYDMFTREGQPMCHVYYLDGSKTTYRKQAKEQA